MSNRTLPTAMPKTLPSLLLPAMLLAGLCLAPLAGAPPALASTLQAEMQAEMQAEDGPATMIYLRGNVTVEGQMVTLGDLLVGVPDLVADIPVTRAPEPGESGRVRTYDVQRAAQRHGVDWKPFSEARTIEVSRRGQLVDRAELNRAILEVLQDQIDHADHEVYITGRVRDLYVSLDAMVDVVVDSIDYRPENGRFEAVLRLSDEPGGQPLRLSGQVIEMTDLPMLSRRMQNGEIITADDIIYRKVRADRVALNVITDASGLIGRTPQRAIQASRNIRENDITVPQDVLRNEMVTMVVSSGSMILTTTGQALEAGARGDVIGVRNTHSKRVVRGVIIGPGEVHMVVGHQVMSQRIAGNGLSAAQAALAQARQ